MKHFKTSLIALSAFAAIGAHAADLTIDFNNAQNQPGVDQYYGAFVYNGTYYGNDTVKPELDRVETLNLATLPKHAVLRNDKDENGRVISQTVKDGILLDGHTENGAKVGYAVYGVYVQDYSAIVGNGVKGVANQEIQRDKFIKTIIGDKFEGQLNAGSYSYTGKAFTNFGEGKFTYAINASDAANAKGSGHVDLGNLKWDPTSGADRLALAIDLPEASVNNGKTASTSIAADNIHVDRQDAWDHVYNQDRKPITYNLQLFGPNGEEVAGTLDGLPNRIGQVGLGASQNNPNEQLDIIKIK